LFWGEVSEINRNLPTCHDDEPGWMETRLTTPHRWMSLMAGLIGKENEQSGSEANEGVEAALVDHWLLVTDFRHK
jgi:hypothetical protein